MSRAPNTSVSLLSNKHELQTTVDLPIDYVEAARVANEAFDQPDEFSAAHMQWLYESCFSEGASLVSLRSGDEKVGQLAIVRQSIVEAGAIQPAAQLVDLLILKPYRSRQALVSLYQAVEDQCRAANLRYAIGMPNDKAIAVNEHFFGLRSHLLLDIRAGLSLPFRSSAATIDERYTQERRSFYRELFQKYQPPLTEQGVYWTADRLCARLENPKFSYGIHATNNVLLVSSARARRGIPYTLLCAFFTQHGAAVDMQDINTVTRAACGLWRRPLFVYPGIHRALTHLPGRSLPRWLRPSTMLVQVRDFAQSTPSLTFDRFQALDFDFG